MGSYVQPLNELLRSGPRNDLVLLSRQDEDLLSQKRIRLVGGTIRGSHRVGAFDDSNERVGYMRRTEWQLMRLGPLGYEREVIRASCQ